MNIGYDHYRIFLYVARCGSLSGAASLLYSNQPNLTRAIRSLEAELGCPLFLRSNRGMRLTPEGERLYRHVEAAFSELEAGEAEIRESRSLSHGTVSVAASEVALHCLLLPVLREYRRRYPGVRIRISNHNSPQAVAAVQAGTADLAVVTTPTTRAPSLVEVPLLSLREAAVCGDDFSFLCGRRVPFAELLEHPVVSLGPQTGSFGLYAGFFAGWGLHFRPEIEAATADQILPMVSAGLGVGFVPEAFLEKEDGVRVIETEAPLPKRTVCLIRRREQPLGIAAARLAQLLEETSSQSEHRETLAAEKQPRDKRVQETRPQDTRSRENSREE